MNEHAEEQRRQLHPPRGLNGHRSGPVREVWVDRSGPEMESQPGMKEQVNQADSDGGDKCVWMMFGMCVCAGCCQDRDQFNPPSERSPRPPLPHRSSVMSESLF